MSESTGPLQTVIQPEPTMRVMSGVQIGDLLDDGEATVGFARSADHRMFRLSGPQIALLGCFAGGSTVSTIAKQNGMAHATVRSATQQLVRAGLVQIDGYAPVSTPARTESERQPPYFERHGLGGKFVVCDPGSALRKVGAIGADRVARLLAWTTAVLAVLTVVLSVSRLPELFRDVREGAHGWMFWAAFVATWFVGSSLHEVGHGAAAVAVGGDATEIGLRWRGLWLAPYCRTEGIQVVNGRLRRAWVALCGPAVGLIVALPFLLAWLAEPRTWLAVVVLLSLATSTIGLLPFPGLDGYHVVNHATGHVNLAGEGVRALRAGRGGVARTYVLVMGAVGMLLVVSIVAMWFLTLRAWRGSGIALTILALELVVVLAVAVMFRRRQAR